MSASDLSATIANMMEVLDPRRSKRKTELRSLLELSSPIKRRLSSESSESPDKRSRNDNSLDVSWLSSPRETRRIRTDLVEARNYIANLEHRIQHMHGVRKELQTMFDNEIKSLQHQHDRDQKTIQELELQMQSVRKREQEVKKELDELKDEYSICKMEYESRIQDMESTINELQNQIQEVESEDQNQLSVILAENMELKQSLENAQKETEFHKELVVDLKTKLNKTTGTSNDLEIKEQLLQKAHLKIKDLEYTLESYGEWQTQSKLMQHRLSAYPDLEREVHRLREESKNLSDEIQNKLILEEQVHDLNTRLEHYRSQDKKMTNLQVSNAQLEQIVNEWYTLARNFVEIPCPDSFLSKHLRQCIEHLQQQEITLTTEKIQLESQQKSLLHDLKIVKMDKEKIQKLNSDLQTSQQQHQMLVHRLQKKLMLVSRERDSYRLQLDSYEKDLTVNFSSGSQGVVHAQYTVQKERIDGLEKILEGYRDILSDLESQLKEAQSQLNTDDLVPVRSEQIARLQEEIERLQNENSRLTTRCDELEIKLEEELVGKDIVQGKVLHFKMNPIAETIAENEATIEKLQEEVDRLKHKLHNMEEGMETSKLSESICSTREVQMLKEQLKSSEIKMQRLKEYFKTASSEFRNVCYMLLGYKIDRVSNTRYKLSSMYAETPDDHLDFQLNNDGNLNMLETQFSSTLEDMVDLHLRHQSSIPMFLSAVTMELFNRTTISTQIVSE